MWRFVSRQLLFGAALGMALAVTGCIARSDAMRPIQAPLPPLPASQHALVVFVRPSLYGYGKEFPIFDAEGRLLGVSTAASWFAVGLLPGEHFFFASGENIAALRATLAPGHTYFVEVSPRFGFWTVRVQLRAIAPRFERWQEREAWIAHTSGYKMIDPSAEDISSDEEEIAAIVERGFELLSEYNERELDERTLYASDGLPGAFDKAAVPSLPSR